MYKVLPFDCQMSENKRSSMLTQKKKEAEIKSLHDNIISIEFTLYISIILVMNSTSFTKRTESRQFGALNNIKAFKM